MTDTPFYITIIDVIQIKISYISSFLERDRETAWVERVKK